MDNLELLCHIHIYILTSAARRFDSYLRNIDINIKINIKID